MSRTNLARFSEVNSDMAAFASARTQLKKLNVFTQRHSHLVTRGMMIAVMALVVLLPLSGCRKDRDPGNGTGALAPDDFIMPDTPTYAEFVAAQNGRVEAIGDFWSRVSLRAEWEDEEGEQYREEGEGHLILRIPWQTSLTVGKVGEIGYWAGSDEEHFWMFDSVDNDNSVAFVARNENAFNACSRPLPLAVHPLEVVDLLGLSELPRSMPIDLGRIEGDAAVGRDASADGTDLSTDSAQPAVLVDAEARAWGVTIAGAFSIRRLWFNADDGDYLPDRVELINPTDNAVLAVAELTDYVALDALGLSPANQPRVPTRIWVTPGGADVDPDRNYIRLTLADPADRPAARRAINPGVFEFSVIQRQMSPDRIEVLDAECPEPALIAEVTE
ncbi:MAG: hypothetical protein ACOC0P_05845 [Planctomycetota bacterium]